MFKRCSNCKHCSLDLRALWVADIWIMKCHQKDECVLHPFFSGWRCKEWRKRDGK